MLFVGLALMIRFLCLARYSLFIQELWCKGDFIVPINSEGINSVVLEISLILQLMAYPPIEQRREVKSPLFPIAEMNDECVIIQVVCLLDG